MLASKYSPFEAVYQSTRVFHYSYLFWNSYKVITFNESVPIVFSCFFFFSSLSANPEVSAFIISDELRKRSRSSSNAFIHHCFCPCKQARHRFGCNYMHSQFLDQNSLAGVSAHSNHVSMFINCSEIVLQGHFMNFHGVLNGFGGRR